MSDNVSYATTAGTAEKATGDKNGKDITTYMAYAKWDTENNTTLHLQNSSGANIFSAKLADKFLPLVAGSAHPLIGDLYISAGDEDRFLQFSYTGTGYDWRIGYLGSGSGNENYLVFQSNGTDGVTWTNALRFGLTDLNATFGGSILPSSTGTKDIGSSGLRWKGLYGQTLNITGNATIGDATTDAHIIKGKITQTGDIIPGVNATYNLGSTTSKWKALYVGNGADGSANSGAITVDGGIHTTKNIYTDAGISVADINSAIFRCNTTTAYSPSSTAITSSPFARDLWHDHLAFLASGHTIVSNQVSSDGSTWIDDTLDLTPLFMQKENNRVEILSKSQLSRRFTLSTISFQYSGIRWYEIGVSYTSPFSQFQIHIESSSDGSTWTEVHLSTIENSSRPYFLYGSDFGNKKFLRFTFTKTTNTTTGSVNLTSIKGYTTRKGDQGLGIENEQPYDWNASRDIYPHTDNTRSLGLSSKKWKDVYATTFIGNLNGNANTATRATNDSSGRNIEQTYLKNVSLKNEYELYKTIGNGKETLIGAVAPLDSNHLIPLKYLPAAALERIHLVETDSDRLKLTILEVQNGDVVRVNQTNRMYIVYDDTKLGTEDAFRVFVAGSAASADTARYAESAGRATNDSAGNEISTSYIKYPFTLNKDKTQVKIANGKGAETTLDYNYYPTAMTWIKGTSEGPTATIDMAGIADIAVNAIPKATKTDSGIVIVGTQTFGGAKTFDNNVTVQKVLKAGNGIQSNSTDTGAVQVSGGLGVTKNTWIGETLNVVGATTLKSTLAVTGETTLTGKLTAKGAVQLGDAESDAISIVGDTSFTNDVTIGKTLTVNGSVSTKGAVTLGDAESDTVTVNGDTSFKNDVTIQKTLTVSKQVKIGNGADISTDPCDLEVTGGVDIGSNLRVTGGTANTATIEFKQEAKVVYDATKNAFNFVFN